jgi:hypothetical protein
MSRSLRPPAKKGIVVLADLARQLRRWPAFRLTCARRSIGRHVRRRPKELHGFGDDLDRLPFASVSRLVLAPFQSAVDGHWASL